ncbi:hypothetical protein P280DRAFT_523704 [Massarina eburnea CBS 473.64]|uniref:Uncharacterized protein n=1 Tax=Massarina eburnea CBS 473.64 TaxID=1395130 RepID=A0A6A6RLH1_9PLEO|nr:hypothetical protein P280DRAFT_523704 [Massarina eburnea CBS 473.64]
MASIFHGSIKSKSKVKKGKGVVRVTSPPKQPDIATQYFEQGMTPAAKHLAQARQKIEETTQRAAQEARERKSNNREEHIEWELRCKDVRNSQRELSLWLTHSLLGTWKNSEVVADEAKTCAAAWTTIWVNLSAHDRTKTATVEKFNTFKVQMKATNQPTQHHEHITRRWMQDQGWTDGGWDWKCSKQIREMRERAVKDRVEQQARKTGNVSGNSIGGKSMDVNLRGGVLRVIGGKKK